MPNGKIFPLVGLNESGKTTLLESIFFFQDGVSTGKEHEIIHKKDAGNFSGEVSIEAFLELDESDKLFIRQFLQQRKLILQADIDLVSVKKEHTYSNAGYKGGTTTWIFTPELRVKSSRQKTYKRLYDSDQNLWTELTDVLKIRFPKILYFPNFLFDFPTKIYLENIDQLSLSDKDKEIQEEYRHIIDDILRHINPNYSVTDYLSKLKATSDPSKQSAATQIKQQISTTLSRKIVSPWQQIFPGPSKSISIETDHDNFGYYLQIKITEGSCVFLVNERSLGFRWFFGFILFTEFRKKRQDEHGEYVFLFDEPASNLHERSQQKLLALFENLIDGAKIVYSTHSPYLINPKSILNAFVVKDVGRSVEDEWDFRQNIKCLPYRQFSSENTNSDGRSHFKPILDVLEYVHNDFIPNDSIVFFEGKFDYYTFKVLRHFFPKKTYNFKFFPGSGVSTYENIFREYLTHNYKFIAIFDSDNAGREAKVNYIKNISNELASNLFTLEDVDGTYTNYTTESLFKDEEKIKIQSALFPGSIVYEKSKFNTSMQQYFIDSTKPPLSKETVKNFKNIFDFINAKLTKLKQHASN
jgi:predicted ATPase